MQWYKITGHTLKQAKDENELILEMFFTQWNQSFEEITLLSMWQLFNEYEGQIKQVMSVYHQWMN